MGQFPEVSVALSVAQFQGSSAQFHRLKGLAGLPSGTADMEGIHTAFTLTRPLHRSQGGAIPGRQYTKAKSLPFRQGKSQLQEWFDRGLLSNKEMCECDRDCGYEYVCVLADLSSKKQRDEHAASQPDRIMTLKSILYMSNGEQIQICLVFRINASMFNSL